MIHFELSSDRELFASTLEFAQGQVRRLIEANPDFYPMYTVAGKWNHDGPAWTDWCDGFLPGMMWIFQQYNARHRPDGWMAAEKFWLEQAIHYSKPLEPRQFDRDVHDLGFIFFSTYLRWYKLTEDKRYQDVLVQAGQTMALRFREKGQYLCSFVADHSLFVDIMMNVGIVFYAAQVTGDSDLRQIATRHALTTRRYLVRGDGSTVQEGIFDTETGEFLRESTHQGWRGDSCWARGLGWAMYGFATCYEYSRNPHFLRTAEECADYYITHTPADGVPPWDFNAPAETRRQVDTSAAAIAASGLLRLCRIIADPVKGHFYWSTAIRILRTLCQQYRGDSPDGYEGILKSGVYHFHKQLGVNESVMWGEYFFVEALEQAMRNV